MQIIDVTLVVGPCAPERFAAARQIAEKEKAAFIPASRLAISPDPLDEALALVPWAYTEARAVVEFPTTVPMPHLIGAISDTDEEGTRLVGVTCVVDAVHLLDDMQRDDYVIRRHGLRTEGRSRALLTVEQIEFASTVLLVNWDPLSTQDLSSIMALISHLSPYARLRLDGAGTEAGATSVLPYSAAQERPGWIGILNDDYEPHMTDERVVAFRYEQVRPMHPERLSRLLDEQIAKGAFGTVIRSAGFCRLASRPNVTGRWEHVGQMFSLHPLISDHEYGDDDEMLAFGQDIAFIGVDLDRGALVAALDEAALTNEELAAGPETWSQFLDPFPASQTADDRAE